MSHDDVVVGCDLVLVTLRVGSLPKTESLKAGRACSCFVNRMILGSAAVKQQDLESN